MRKAGTLERLKALRRELVDSKIAEHHGAIVKATGGGGGRQRGRRFTITQASSMSALTGIMSSARSVASSGVQPMARRTAPTICGNRSRADSAIAERPACGAPGPEMAPLPGSQ
ncbi:MAG TPA: hypothetical protein VHT52_06905 [Stellaceae bacterium]|jgi:hypothetical protein|nr:hypothetical protein [Stellaceae bacterium]